MTTKDIFNKIIKLRFRKKVKKKKLNYRSEFLSSQFYAGLNNDKKGLKHLINAEKKVEELSKSFIGKNNFHPFLEYSATSYFVNFQYFVELINVHGRKMGLLKSMRIHANDGWDDLYVSLRLSLMGHYKSSFFHLRSFMENYFMMIWEHSIKYGKIDVETKEFKGIGKHAVKPKFRYLTSSKKNQKLKEHNIDLEYLFDGNEFAKIYDYLSKFTHNQKKIKSDYSETITFNDELFDKYLMLSGLVILLTIRLVYGFTEEKMKKQWLNIIEKPIPWTRNHYRYIIGEMVLGDMFYDLYENKKSRDFFKNEVGIDAEKLYPKLKESIKDLKMYDKLKKESGGDREKYSELIYKWKSK